MHILFFETQDPFFNVTCNQLFLTILEPINLKHQQKQFFLKSFIITRVRITYKNNVLIDTLTLAINIPISAQRKKLNPQKKK